MTSCYSPELRLTKALSVYAKVIASVDNYKFELIRNNQNAQGQQFTESDY